MPRSISIIDYKVSQADFFLTQLEKVGYEFFSAQCFCDAFASASRSVTFAVQSVCKEIDGFEDWYSEEQKTMRKDPVLKFFHNYRTISNHIGETPVLGGSTDHQNPGSMTFFFEPTKDLPKVPDTDVLTSCRYYYEQVLDLVFRLYERFPTDLDDRWHYTAEHFDRKGLSVEDAEEAFGFPRGWTKVEGSEEELKDRWFYLRHYQTCGPQTQEIFHRYLGKIVLGPDDNVEQE